VTEKSREPDPQPGHGQEQKVTGEEALGAAFLAYGLLLAIEFVVLDWRDEAQELSAASFSELPEWQVLLATLACAAVGIGYTALCSRLLPSVRKVEEKFARLCGDPSDLKIAVLCALCAAAEGLFLRYWMQDWRGYWGSVAIAVGFGLGPGVWALWPVHLGLALLLGGMVESGVGIAASILTHALILYGSLRRIFAT